MRFVGPSSSNTFTAKAFRIDLAGSSTGTLYGRGAYLGESISKARNKA